MKTMKMLTKEEAAAEIAEAQYENDEHALAVCRIMAADEDFAAEPLKLLKVSADTLPMGVLPLHFPPKASRGMAFAYELVVITPEEFDDPEPSRLSLPKGWHFGQKIEASRMLAEAAA